MRTRYLLAIFFLIVTTAHAQDPNTENGYIPGHTYQSNDIDSVDIASGNLSLHIPLRSFKQEDPMSIDYSLYSVGKHLGTSTVDSLGSSVGMTYWMDPRIPLTWEQVNDGWNNPAGIDTLPVPTYAGVYLESSEDWIGVDISIEAAELGDTDPMAEAVSPDGSPHMFLEPEPGATNLLAPADASGYVMSSNGVLDSNGVAHVGGGRQTSGPLYIDRNYPSPMVNTNSTTNLTTITDLDGRTLPYTNTMGGPSPGCSSVSSCQDQGSAADPSICPAVDSEPRATVAREIDFPGSVSTEAYYFCYVSIQIKTYFPPTLAYNTPFAPMLFLQAVVLPNGKWWGFEYDDKSPAYTYTTDISTINIAADPSDANYGSVTKVIYPTGAYTTYQYISLDLCVDQRDGNPTSRYLISKSEYASPGATPATWTYASDVNGRAFVTTPDGRNQVYYFAEPDSNRCPAFEIQFTDTDNTVKYFSDSIIGSQDINNDVQNYGVFSAFGLIPADNYVVTNETDYFPDLRFFSTYKIYDSEGTPVNGSPGSFSHGNIVEEYTYPAVADAPDPPGFDEGVQIFRAKNGNGAMPTNILTDVRTTYDYQKSPAVLNANLIHLVSDKSTYDGACHKLEGTSNTYADGVSSPALELSNGVPWPGFRTSTTPWLNTPGPSTTTTYTPDGNGEVASETDPNGNTTTYGRSSNGVYVTSVNRWTNGLPRTTSSTYDLASDQLASRTDENGNTTWYDYGPLERLIEVQPPLLPAGKPEVNLCYTDLQTCPVVGSTPLTVVSQTAQSTGGPLVTLSQTYDGFGRPIQSVLYDNQGPIQTVTTYDVLGRKNTVTNPFRSTSDPTYGINQYFYQFPEDAETSITRPDGTSVTNWLGYTESDGNGDNVVPNIDTYGRLLSVTDAGGMTTYTRDPLNNLTQLNQYGHIRQFQYDSMSRLIKALNPETGVATTGPCAGWSTCYTYDGAGNLVAKTDARGITTNMAYDGLNRIISKTYSGPGTSTMPATCYMYDVPPILPTYSGGEDVPPAGSNFMGRLSMEWTQADGCSTGSSGTIQATLGYLNLTSHAILNYDVLGHVTSDVRCVGSLGFCAQTNNTYDLAGNLTQYSTFSTSPCLCTVPSTGGSPAIAPGTPVTVTNNYDSANRLQQVLSQFGSLPITSMYAVQSFSPAGPTSADIGSSMTTNHSYDSMMRPTSESTVVKP